MSRKSSAILSFDTDQRPTRPALTPDARENQLIALAVDLAEKQLREGTASSQIIAHYIKRGSEKEREELELKILEKQKDLLEAKAEQIKSQKRTEELYSNALKAMSVYSGSDERPD